MTVTCICGRTLKSRSGFATHARTCEQEKARRAAFVAAIEASAPDQATSAVEAPTRVVHHVDGDPRNDEPSNLVIEDVDPAEREPEPETLAEIIAANDAEIPEDEQGTPLRCGLITRTVKRALRDGGTILRLVKVTTKPITGVNTYSGMYETTVNYKGYGDANGAKRVRETLATLAGRVSWGSETHIGSQYITLITAPYTGATSMDYAHENALAEHAKRTAAEPGGGKSNAVAALLAQHPDATVTVVDGDKSRIEWTETTWAGPGAVSPMPTGQPCPANQSVLLPTAEDDTPAWLVTWDRDGERHSRYEQSRTGALAWATQLMGDDAVTVVRMHQEDNRPGLPVDSDQYRWRLVCAEAINRLVHPGNYPGTMHRVGLAAEVAVDLVGWDRFNNITRAVLRLAALQLEPGSPDYSDRLNVAIQRVRDAVQERYATDVKDLATSDAICRQAAAWVKEMLARPELATTGTPAPSVYCEAHPGAHKQCEGCRYPHLIAPVGAEPTVGHPLTSGD